MATTARAGQTARQMARERRIGLEAATKARNDRIENWTTAVFAGAEERQRAHRAQAAAEDAMADALLGLAGEGLSTSEVADLCVMTVGEVHKLTKRRRLTTHKQPSSPFRANGRSVASLAAGRPRVDSENAGGTPSGPSRETDIGAVNG